MDARKTFRETVRETAQGSAEAAWDRARLASHLRHAAARQGHRRTARRLGELKREAISRVLRLQPGTVRVTVDSDYHVGLLSIRWSGHGSLHLPADTDLRPSAREGTMAS